MNRIVMKALAAMCAAWLPTTTLQAQAASAPTVVAAAPARSPQERLAALAAQTPGRLGVAAIEIETGRRIGVNGGERFPMASTFKVAVAATFLEGVDRKLLRLDQLYTLDERMRVRSEGIATFVPHPGVALSAANLIELMLTRSDNTAADMLTQAVGGPGAVTAWLRRAGIGGQRVDRDTALLILEEIGGTPAPGLTAAETLARVSPPAPWLKDVSGPKVAGFDADPRDTSTPDAMATLLAKLYRGELLSAESRGFLFAVLERTSTGGNRIRGLLPPGTPVAHKTGTLEGISNDAGIVTLPNGRHLALAVFVKSQPDAPARSRRIAEAARAAYDAFATAK
jgi:beta-lactamase class A